MKVEELKRHLLNTAIADYLRAADGGAILGSAILALCVLDYLSALRSKHPALPGGLWPVAKNYKDFVDDFLVPVNAKYRGADVYWLRCALAHTYALAEAKKDTNIRRYRLTHLDPAFHLAGVTDTLQLNADTFVADVIVAANAFFAGVVGDVDVEARADELLAIENTPPPATFKEMHRALAALDESTLNESKLRANVTACYTRTTVHISGSTLNPGVTGTA